MKAPAVTKTKTRQIRVSPENFVRLKAARKVTHPHFTLPGFYNLVVEAGMEQIRKTNK